METGRQGNIRPPAPTPETRPSSPGEESSSEEEDPELAQLLRENSDLSSSSEDNEAAGPAIQVVIERKRRGTNLYEQPSSNIAVLMLACWSLRIPVLYRDLIKSSRTLNMVYLPLILSAGL